MVALVIDLLLHFEFTKTNTASKISPIRVAIRFLNQKWNYLCFPNCMCEHYIENTLILSILICQALCLMQVQTEKEIHTATSSCKLTTDHWAGETEALFSPSTKSQMWCRWLSWVRPGLGSSCSSREGAWPGPGAYPVPPHVLASGGGKGASSWDKEYPLAS